jgi:VIT1/CCC1 family predicted Fe2+/Mn2+ transporter
MAVGEYSSVSSQRDAEEADLATERRELATSPRSELAELTSIYERRGLPAPLAHQVAEGLMAHDALASHARDELGLDLTQLARPFQAAVVSAVSFTIGAVVPLLVAVLSVKGFRVPATVIVTLIGLGMLGALGAALGGAPRGRAAARVLVGGAAAMALTWAVGSAVGVNV